MKFEVEKKNIKEALKKMSFFFTNSSSEWSNAVSLIVKVRDGYSALDLFMQNPTESFQTLVLADFVEDYQDEEIVVDGVLLSEIVSKAVSGKITFYVDFNLGSLNVTAGDTTWTLPFLIKTLTRVKCESEAEIWQTEELSASLKRVRNSLGLDIGRPYLMLANISSGKVQACDGFKLQETRISNKNLEVGIPSNSIQPLLRLLEADGWKEQDFAIHDEGRVVCFRASNDKYSFFKPKSPFPDLTAMVINPIKSKVPSLITIERSTLIARIEQVCLVADKKAPQIQFELEEGKLTLTCTGRSGFKSESTLETNWAGARKVLCFDIKSLLEVLRSVKEDKIEIRFSKDKKDENGPIVIEGDNLWSMVNQQKSMA